MVAPGVPGTNAGALVHAQLTARRRRTIQSGHRARGRDLVEVVVGVPDGGYAAPDRPVTSVTRRGLVRGYVGNREFCSSMRTGKEDSWSNPQCGPGGPWSWDRSYWSWPLSRPFKATRAALQHS